MFHLHEVKTFGVDFALGLVLTFPFHKIIVFFFHEKLE